MFYFEAVISRGFSLRECTPNHISFQTSDGGNGMARTYTIRDTTKTSLTRIGSTNSISRAQFSVRGRTSPHGGREMDGRIGRKVDRCDRRTKRDTKLNLRRPTLSHRTIHRVPQVCSVLYCMVIEGGSRIHHIAYNGLNGPRRKSTSDLHGLSRWGHGR
jgi:hypothetical protein